jgi:ankyrin repeat protein
MISDREFYQSVKSHQFENAQSLLLRGDVNINSKLNIGLMMEAINSKDIGIVEFLIFNKIDLNIKSIGGFSLLHRAIYNGDYFIIKTLIEGGASVNIHFGQQHLDFALSNYFLNQNEDRFKCIKLLLENGAKIFFEEKGENALDISIFHDNYECTKLLLNYINEEHVENGMIQNLIPKTKSPEIKKLLLDYIEEMLAFCNKCPEEMN